MQDLWEIRIQAVQFALTGSAGFMSPDELIERADAIEQYIKHGRISPEMQAILNDQGPMTEAN